MPLIFKHVPAQCPPGPVKLAFVGEAPGDTEVCRGIPLCGPAGRMFNKLLRLAGISREEHWVGNVFDEKLPENDLKRWCARSKVAKEEGWLMEEDKLWNIPGAGILRPEHRWHLARLQAELEEARPNVLVTLGGTALWPFLRNTNVTAARGTVSRSTWVMEGSKVLPTFHPQFVIYTTKSQGTVVNDFRRALLEANRGVDASPIRSPRELWLLPSLADLDRFWEQHLSTTHLISCDIETVGGQISAVGFGTGDFRRAISVPFVAWDQLDRSYWRTPEEEGAAWDWVRRVGASPIPKLFQNGPFDNWWLLRYGCKMMNWRHDTRLGHHALYPELPKSLAYMGSVYAQEGPWKLMREREEKRDA